MRFLLALELRSCIFVQKPCQLAFRRHHLNRQRLRLLTIAQSHMNRMGFTSPGYYERNIRRRIDHWERKSNSFWRGFR
ncbi:hypothetical protein Hanom_Chr08g00717581 [Helianthus anomalus]